jgi:hypothetical protein
MPSNEASYTDSIKQIAYRIWELRGEQPTDDWANWFLAERVYRYASQAKSASQAATKAAEKPLLSQSPVNQYLQSDSRRIIHISDLHIAATTPPFPGIDVTNSVPYPWYPDSDRLTTIGDFLINNKETLNASIVLISGDLTDGGDSSDYDLVAPFINKLLNNGFNVYSIPGNHDYAAHGTLAWADERKRDNFATLVPRAYAKDAYPVEVDIPNGKLILLDSMQAELLEDNYGMEWKWWGIIPYYWFKDGDQQAQGKLGTDQLNKLSGILEGCQNARKNGYKVIVSLHHNPFSQSGSGMLHDSDDFLSRIAGKIDGKIDCLLCGHQGDPWQHLSDYEDTFVSPLPSKKQYTLDLQIANKVNLQHVKDQNIENVEAVARAIILDAFLGGAIAADPNDPIAALLFSADIVSIVSTYQAYIDNSCQAYPICVMDLEKNQMEVYYTDQSATTIERGNVARAVAPWRTSGFLKQGTLDSHGNLGNRGNFEMVIPAPNGGEGLAHYIRDNDAEGIAPWHGPTIFGTGPFDSTSLIQSTCGLAGTLGTLEVAARCGSTIRFFSRINVPPFNWTEIEATDASGNVIEIDNVSGNPCLIQSTLGGSPGDFKLVVPLAQGGLAFCTRHNNVNGRPWERHDNILAQDGVMLGAALIQSDFNGGIGMPFYLEMVVVFENGKLAHYQQNYEGQWDRTDFGEPNTLHCGTPALIQGTFGPNGCENFELVVPIQGGGFAHYERLPTPIAATPTSSLNLPAFIRLYSCSFGPGSDSAVTVFCSPISIDENHNVVAGSPESIPVEPGWKFRPPKPNEIFRITGLNKDVLESGVQIQIRIYDSHYICIDHDEEAHQDYVMADATTPNEGSALFTIILKQSTGPQNYYINIQAWDGRFLIMPPSEEGPLELGEVPTTLVLEWVSPEYSWQMNRIMATPALSSLSMIQSNYGDKGHLEVVTIEEDSKNMTSYWRDDNDPDYTWYGPLPVIPINLPAFRLYSCSFGHGSDNDVTAFCIPISIDENHNVVAGSPESIPVEPSWKFRPPKPNEFFWITGLIKCILESGDKIQIRTFDGHYIWIDHDEDAHDDYVMADATTPNDDSALFRVGFEPPTDPQNSIYYINIQARDGRCLGLPASCEATPPSGGPLQLVDCTGSRSIFVLEFLT